jgi:hypothetical protein
MLPSIRRAVLAAAAALLAASPLACAQTAFAAYPPVPGTVSVSATTVVAGGQLGFTASGFDAGEMILVELGGLLAPPPQNRTADVPDSSEKGHGGVSLGTFQADGRGDLTGTVTVPSDMRPGTHRLTLTGQNSNLTLAARITVRPSHGRPGAPGTEGPDNSTGQSAHQESSLAMTGANGTLVSVCAATGLALAGSGATLIARRRRSGGGRR